MGRSRGARLSLDRRHEATVDRVAAWQGCRDIDVRCGSVGQRDQENRIRFAKTNVEKNNHEHSMILHPALLRLGPVV
jgi:hypothetical protein